MFDIEGIDKPKITEALQNNKFPDFEDCLQIECAVAYGADYIITRNCDDFEESKIPVITPDAFCKLLDVAEEEVGAEREQTIDIVNRLDWDYDVVLAPVLQNYKTYEYYLPVSVFYQNVQKEGVKIA